MENKKFGLILLTTILLLAGIVSAANLELVETNIPDSVSHNQGSVTVEFNLTCSGNDYDELNWSATTNMGEWTTLPTLTNIDDGETRSLSAVLTFPEHSSGTINAEIKLESETTAKDELPVSIQILSNSSLSVTQPTKITQSQNSTFTIKNTGNTQLTPSVAVDSVEGLSFSISSLSAISPGNSATVTIGATMPSSFPLSGNSTTVHVTAPGVNEITKSLNIERSYCDYGCNGEDLLDLDVEIENEKGFGKEDDEWYPLDEIKVTIDVDNDAADSINDIIIEWCLYNPEKGKCIMDDKLSKFNLKEDKDKTTIVNFQLDPDEVDEDVEDYIFYVKVYSDDSDYGESELCLDYSEPIKIIRDDHFVILGDVEIPVSVPCGSESTISANVWNIGDNDEDSVYVNIYNKKLNINQNIDIGDIKILRKKLLDFTFDIPQDADEESYILEFRVYDEDDDIFESSEDEEAKFTYGMKVSGNCKSESEASVQITAVLKTLENNIAPGKDVTISSTIKNTGAKDTTYSLSLEGAEFFSSTSSITPSTVTLKSGESQDVLITLKLNEDSQGEQVFYIKAVYDGKTTKQPVSLSIPSATTSNFLSNLKGNNFVWIIVGINVVLILAIIIVVVRMQRV
ncbi:MAG: putative S-layer protein [Nanoarchaeota archaeon]|nr:putative S-layer protein [Nanoarchaeota archaeon]